MKIDLTKEQYQNLCKAIYLGNYLANGPREDDYLEEIEGIEQYIYSFFKEFESEDLIEEDEGKFTLQLNLRMKWMTLFHIMMLKVSGRCCLMSSASVISWKNTVRL
jgi:hypothetical protein